MNSYLTTINGNAVTFKLNNQLKMKMLIHGTDSQEYDVVSLVATGDLPQETVDAISKASIVLGREKYKNPMF